MSSLGVEIDSSTRALGSWAIVTGGFSGIGLEAVREFLERGLTVLAVDKADFSILEDSPWVDSHIATERLRLLQLDVKDDGFELIEKSLGIAGARNEIGHLVNCAASFQSVGRGGSRDEWSDVLNTNLISPAIISNWFFETASQGSTIVNVASISAHVAQPGRWAYNASKAGLVSLTRGMALDFAERGIRVNCVSPGWTKTPEVQRAADSVPDSVSERWKDFQMVGRLGLPKEIARAIVFLSSSDSSFITGIEMMVDGGYSALGPEGIGRNSVFAS